MSSPDNFMEMSDEEFEKLLAPPAVEGASSSGETATPAASAENSGESEVSAAEASEAVAGQEDSAGQATEEDPADEETAQAAAPPPLVDPASQENAFKDTNAAKQQKSGETDYRVLYEQVMAPFKANGKTIQLQSVDEAVQLMQMGANYTKKMQDLQPKKKLLMMLENNNLLDESKLNFLIDLDKKDPEAIKKLLKDANIDPMEVDTSKVNYRQGNHGVSDQEAALQTAIEDLKAHDGGLETLQSINSWDQVSKKVLWDSPELLQIFHGQMQNGIYSQIVSEVDRRKTLGQLQPNIPFLSAYKTVGDELAARGAFQPAPANSGQRQTAGGTPVAIRPAGRTPPVNTADTRVRAAASTRSTSRSAEVAPNYLSMSDEDFLKQPPPGGR
jgi:hypothetical protein